MRCLRLRHVFLQLFGMTRCLFLPARNSQVAKEELREHQCLRVPYDVVEAQARGVICENSLKKIFLLTEEELLDYVLDLSRAM